jgi:indolepyruvate ferredoxin oxidoreductase
MAQWMNRRTETFTQVGGEGATWIVNITYSS